MQLLLRSAALHWCWLSTDLCEEQIFIGLLAVTNPGFSLLCTAALNSGECILLNAVLQCIGVASLHTYAKQILPGVLVVTQALSQPVLHSSTTKWGKRFVRRVLKCTDVESLLHVLRANLHRYKFNRTCLVLQKKAIGSQEEQADAALELLGPDGQQLQPDMRCAISQDEPCI